MKRSAKAEISVPPRNLVPKNQPPVDLPYFLPPHRRYVIVTCQERDRLILAFALALNEQNEAWDQWELARNPVELEDAKHGIEAARNICRALKSQLLAHCNQHGC